MRQMMVLAAVAACVGLCGCANRNVQWVRPGATAMDFEADKAKCVYESNLATPGSYAGPGLGGAIAAGIADGMRLNQLQVMCMQARGWQQMQVANTPAPDTSGQLTTRSDGVPEPLPVR